MLMAVQPPPMASHALPRATAQGQLVDLLRRRSAADAQALALRRAEIAEGLFRQERVRAQELQAQVRFFHDGLTHPVGHLLCGAVVASEA